jgi:peptidoglycan/xylan/chitin deacetylase (PgdA/CDA1 family)
MTRFFLALPLLAAALLLSQSPPAGAGPLVEPRLTLAGATRQQPHVALTLDACSGGVDMRVINALVSGRTPATVFVTARWLKGNGAALKVLLAHPDLFQIENHGARHVAAIDFPGRVYGIAGAGSAAAVKQEVAGGAAAVLAATGKVPHWFRGATGKYSRGALAVIAATGEAVAGYSLIADGGAALPAASVARRVAGARSGEVIIAHVNHPEKPAGAGLVQGIAALKAKGFVFVKLGPPRPQPAAEPRGS